MQRPVCTACSRSPCAVNYRKENKIYYRTRCDGCIRKGKKVKPAKPRWSLSGYKKKAACDRCGFVAKHACQLQVFHLDGDLSNSELINLRTICLNCAALIQQQDFSWARGDLQEDY